MMILEKKSIFVIFMAVVLLSLSLVTASALEDKSDLITPKFSHIDVFQNEFDISSSGKASILSYLNSDIAEQVRVTGYLQQYKDGGWQNVKSWTNSEYGRDVVCCPISYVTALTPLMEVYMKNSLSKVISFALVFCMILTATTTGFASTTNINNKTQVIKTGENSFIADGEEYVIEKEEFKNITETKMYDSQKKLVGHMKYDQTTGQLFDLFNNEEIEIKVILNEKTLRLMDADGYYYQGDYTINVGLIVGTAACILALTTLGVPLGMATTAALAVTSWASSFIYIEGELWMKSDDTYDYVKKIESVYESISGNNNKLAGPYTLLQKKAI